MKKSALGQWILTFAVLAVIVAALVGAFLLIAKAIEEGANVLAATLAATATVGAAVLVREFERKREVEAARRQHLGGLYEDLASQLSGREMTDRKRQKMILDFMKKAPVYAGPGVIKAFREWRDVIWSLPDKTEAWTQEQGRTNALLFESFAKAMRKDLGVSNFMLAEGDLGRALITDWDEAFGTTSESLEPPEPDEEPLVSKAGEPAKRTPRG